MFNNLHSLNSENNFHVYNRNFPPLLDAYIPLSKLNSGYTNHFCKLGVFHPVVLAYYWKLQNFLLYRRYTTMWCSCLYSCNYLLSDTLRSLLGHHQTYKPDDGPIGVETCRLVDSCRNIDNCTTLLCNDGTTICFITSNISVKLN